MNGFLIVKTCRSAADRSVLRERARRARLAHARTRARCEPDALPLERCDRAGPACAGVASRRRTRRHGTLEPFFLENATRWATALRGAGAEVVMSERVGSHGDAFWREEFPLMVAWGV